MFSDVSVCKPSASVKCAYGNGINKVLQLWCFLSYFRAFFKGSLQWESRGAGKVANVRNTNRSRTVAIEVCLSFNLVGISNFNVFPFPLNKAQSLGDVPMKRQKQRIVHTRFELFLLSVYWRNSFAASIISKFYFADFVFLLPAHKTGWFGASIGSARCKREKKHVPSCRLLPICEDIAYWFCFTQRNRKQLKIKDDSELIKRE